MPSAIDLHPILPLPRETARMLLRACAPPDRPTLQAAFEESFDDLRIGDIENGPHRPGRPELPPGFCVVGGPVVAAVGVGAQALLS